MENKQKKAYRRLTICTKMHKSVRYDIRNVRFL